MQDDEPLADHVPVAHVTHVVIVIAPIALLQDPAGQNFGVRDEKGQYEPAGHMTGVPVLQ